jgi:hypothetical protein
MKKRTGTRASDRARTSTACTSPPKAFAACKDGNGAVSGRISAGFGSSVFGFGLDFWPTVFRFRAPKLIGFGFGSGFSPVDIQWLTEISHYELKFMFYYILIILLLIYYFKLSHEIIYYFVASYLYM